MSNSLRSRRLELEMTQAQVAEVINCNKGTYANIELGKRNPSLETAKRIARVLGSTVDALFSDPTNAAGRVNPAIRRCDNETNPSAATEGERHNQQHFPAVCSSRENIFQF
jgi:putative transcriptional regulator